MSPRFTVLATQNPIEQQGVYPLPEAQLDRFLFKLVVDYPEADEERRIVADQGGRFKSPAVGDFGVTQVADATGIGQAIDKIGRAHVCTPVTNAHLVCRLLLEKKIDIMREPTDNTTRPASDTHDDHQ